MDVAARLVVGSYTGAARRPITTTGSDRTAALRRPSVGTAAANLTRVAGCVLRSRRVRAVACRGEPGHDRRERRIRLIRSPFEAQEPSERLRADEFPASCLLTPRDVDGLAERAFGASPVTVEPELDLATFREQQ